MATKTDTTTHKNAAISARLVALLAAGVPVNKAFDAVLGDGAYMRLVSDLHDAFNSPR